MSTPVSTPIDQIVRFGDKKEACPVCQRDEYLEIGVVMTGCHSCCNSSLNEQRARARKYRDQVFELAGSVKYLEAERELDKMAPDELRKRLDLERARLSVISMDGVSSYTGYDSTTVSSGLSGPALEVSRTNVRQAVDVLAREIWGEDWVNVVLSCTNNSWRESAGAEPGVNPWDGPSEVVWDEEQKKIIRILPEHPEKDDLSLLNASGPLTDEYYAEGEEDKE